MPVQHSYKNSSRKLVALIIMVFSFMGGYTFFTGDVGTIRWNLFYYGRFVLMILYAFYSYSTRTMKSERIVTNWMGRLFFSPPILMLLYSIAIWIIYNAQFRYITRGISNFIFLIGSYISGINMAKVLGKDTTKIGLLSAIITMIISMMLGLVSLGGSFFKKMIEGNNIYVELHEALFVVGLYLVAYIFRHNYFQSRKNKFLFFLGIISFIIGGKRIGFLAVVITSIYGIILKKRTKKTVKGICLITEYVLIGFTIIYTWISVSGVLDALLAKYGIAMMGRDVLYRYFRKFCEYSPTFLGHGIGFVDRTFSYTTSAELYNMASVKALHNDFLKIFIEIGFIGSICWTYYWIRTFTRKMENRFGTAAMLVCLCLFMYSFITYTTDNTAGYFNYQMHLAMLITSIGLQAEESKNDKVQ